MPEFQRRYNNWLKNERREIIIKLNPDNVAATTRLLKNLKRSKSIKTPNGTVSTDLLNVISRPDLKYKYKLRLTWSDRTQVLLYGLSVIEEGEELAAFSNQKEVVLSKTTYPYALKRIMDMCKLTDTVQ